MVQTRRSRSALPSPSVTRTRVLRETPQRRERNRDNDDTTDSNAAQPKLPPRFPPKPKSAKPPPSTLPSREGTTVSRKEPAVEAKVQATKSRRKSLLQEINVEICKDLLSLPDPPSPPLATKPKEHGCDEGMHRRRQEQEPGTKHQWAMSTSSRRKSIGNRRLSAPVIPSPLQDVTNTPSKKSRRSIVTTDKTTPRKESKLDSMQDRLVKRTPERNTTDIGSIRSSKRRRSMFLPSPLRRSNLGAPVRESNKIHSAITTTTTIIMAESKADNHLDSIENNHGGTVTLESDSQIHPKVRPSRRRSQRTSRSQSDAHYDSDSSRQPSSFGDTDCTGTFASAANPLITTQTVQGHSITQDVAATHDNGHDKDVTMTNVGTTRDDNEDTLQLDLDEEFFHARRKSTRNDRRLSLALPRQRFNDKNTDNTMHQSEMLSSSSSSLLSTTTLQPVKTPIKVDRPRLPKGPLKTHQHSSRMGLDRTTTAISAESSLTAVRPKRRQSIAPTSSSGSASLATTVVGENCIDTDKSDLTLSFETDPVSLKRQRKSLCLPIVPDRDKLQMPTGTLGLVPTIKVNHEDLSRVRDLVRKLCPGKKTGVPPKQDRDLIAREIHVLSGYPVSLYDKEATDATDGTDSQPIPTVKDLYTDLAPYLEKMEQAKIAQQDYLEAETGCQVDKTRTGKSRYYDVKTGERVDPATYEKRYLEAVGKTKRQRVQHFQSTVMALGGVCDGTDGNVPTNRDNHIKEEPDKDKDDGDGNKSQTLTSRKEEEQEQQQEEFANRLAKELNLPDRSQPSSNPAIAAAERKLWNTIDEAYEKYSNEVLAIRGGM